MRKERERERDRARNRWKEKEFKRGSRERNEEEKLDKQSRFSSRNYIIIQNR